MNFANGSHYCRCAYAFLTCLHRHTAMQSKESSVGAQRILTHSVYIEGETVVRLVEAVRCTAEDRGFDSRRCH